MYWKQKIAVKPVAPAKAGAASLIKPSTRRSVKRAKRIDFRLPCYLLVEPEGTFVEATTVNLSKGGVLIHSLEPLEFGQEVLCLIWNQRNLKKIHLMNNKNTLKGKVVRVEKKELLYRSAIQITFGRVNPVAHIQFPDDNKFWWSRFWQIMEESE